MILEIDLGNSNLKWRLCTPEAGPVHVAASTAELLCALQALGAPSRCRMVSVRHPEVTEAIREELSSCLGVPVATALPARVLAGVTNGYRDYRSLGLDRWMALVAAYREVGGAAMVIDLGTAMTIDFVTATGAHLGGYITPGLGLMKAELERRTDRVRLPGRYEGDGPALAGPGNSTEEAFLRGVHGMVRAFVMEQIAAAPALLGDEPSILATGGDAWLIGDLPGVQVVPDLVFRGLALACP